MCADCHALCGMPAVWQLIDTDAHILGHGRRSLMMIEIFDLRQHMWWVALDACPQ
jgi:hypothetical protein